MAGQKFTLTFDANLNVSQMKGALGQIQSTLNGLHLPQNVTKGLQGTFDKLQKEIQAFEVAASKDITSKTDFKKLETQAAKVTDAFEKLKIQVRDLAKLNAKDLEKLFPQKITQNIQDATNAVKQYQVNMASTTKEVNKAQTVVNKLTAEAAKIQGKQVLTGDQYKQLTDNLKTAEQEVNNLEDKLKQLNSQEEQMRGSLSQPNKSSRYRQLVQDIKDVNDQLTTTRQNAERLANQKANSTTFEKQAKDLADLNAKLAEATNKLNQYKQDLANIQSTSQGGGLKSLLDDIGRLTGMDMSKFSQDTKGAADAIQAYLNQELQKLNNNLHTVENTVNGASKPFEDLSHNVRDSGDALEQFNTQAKEIDQLKSRIQYFFGLNNAINLVKRTMREAYDTIKELDKAMTETAVVTDFSVGDMWAQLSDYTKRANELGVSTKAVYEAATLYYQQGLKTNEVMAMSNETLKMARIAGLDAAVATDRMTNAIRGFNMEINTTNAQRIDDVYSRLAAISASNVDEISTAMTKVASLAHSANMEFETTAAFLAQIIETTRESAETAGTALKTVVARFSEVKKLVNEGELSGSDEEGELIDVNKVSSALRVAGIDLNKYFLGQVGLDDIFMELASKWNQLTTLQQRYIATQAAGSRQQSRFIALMSDYARTQELVGEAYKANGAAAKQFAKTQESLESKLARLKNAWNEFAMGILNSDLVKIGVDLLTNILNGINALTSGFGLLDKGVGGVINSISKLILLFGSLGAGKTLLSGLTASISNIGLTAAGKAPLDIAKVMSTAAVGTNATGALAGLAGRGKGGALLAGFLNPFTGIGNIAKAGWSGAKNLGVKMWGAGNGAAAGIWGAGQSLTGSAGLAAGAAGIGTIVAALGAVATAAGVAYIVIKKLYDASPAGQVKIAEKYAESMQQAADTAKQTAADFEKVQQEYSALDNAVSNASNLEERTEAIKSRSEYVKSLIEQNSVYAQYLQDTKFENGEFYLTLDSKKLEEACNNIAKAAVEAAAANNLAQSNLAYQEYEKYQAEYQREVNRKNLTEINPNVRNEAAWTVEDEQYLIDLQARMQEKLAESTNYAMQTASSYIDTSELSDAAASYLTSAIGEGLSSDAVSKKVKEESKEISGDIDELYKIAFGETGEGLKKEEKKLALAVRNANLQLAKDFEPFISSFKQLPEEAQKVLYEISSNNGYGLTRKEYAEVAQVSPKEWFTYINSDGEESNLLDLIPDEEMREEILNAFTNGLNKENPFDILSKSIDSIFKDPLTNDFKGFFNRTVREFKLTAEQASVFPRLFKEFMTYGQGSIEDFTTFLTGLISSVPKNKLNDLFNLLDNLNFQDSGTLKVFLESLEDLNPNWDAMGHSAESAAEALKKFTNSVEEFNMDNFRNEIVDNVSLMRDIKDRKSGSAGYRVFSQDEHDLLLQSGISEDQFVFSGIKNKEYTYTGESLDSLVEILVNGLTQKVIKAEATLDDKIAQGQWMANLGQPIIDELTKIINSGELTQEQVNNADWIEQIITKFRGEEALTLPPDQLLEILKQAFQWYRDLEANTTAKETIQTQASQSMNYITPINEFKPEISSEEYNTAVTSKFYVDEHAEDRYEDILKSLEQINKAGVKWGETAQDIETISRALSVNWSEQASKLTELTEVLDKNDKILYESSKDSYEYSSAIHAVGEAMRAAYGEQVSDEFVQAHIQQIVMARESQEAYQELLNILQQDFFSNAKSGLDEFGYMLAAIQQQMIEDGLTAESLNGLEINGVAVLDDTLWMSVIEQLIKAGYDVAAFFDTLGWTVTYGPTDKNGVPTSVQLVRNQPTGYGGYQPYTGSNWGHGSSGGGGSGSSAKEPTKEEWRSDFDWLYNLMEDLAELQREQNKLQEEQNKILELGNDSDTGKDLYENLVKQMANLLTQKTYQSSVQSNRRREMQEFMAANAAYGNYLRFNNKDQTLEINWDAINNIGDKETYEKVKDLVSEAEAIQKKMDESDDALRDIEAQIRHLEDIWRESYVDFEKRVLDALVKSYQRTIDNYSDLNNTVNKANEEILSALQEEIALERQIRNNTKTEETISDTEARLAFLRRDTTGGNQVAILKTQKELEEARQSYEDTLVDQSISRLQDDNAKAAEQREKQIELMQAQLDYAAQNGDFNNEVQELISGALGADGELLTNSDLFNLLQQEESWAAMSATNKELWEDELNNTFKEVSAYLLKEQGEIDGSYLQAVASQINDGVWASASIVGSSLEVGLGSMGQSIGWAIGSMSQAIDHIVYSYDNAVSALNNANSQLASQVSAGESNYNYGLQTYGGSGYTVTQNGNPIATAHQGGSYSEVLEDLKKLRGYKTGGLTTKTGPAWLDGTPSEPEYVLNARQTEAFLKLADVLPSMFNNVPATTNNIGGTMYLNFDINVDNISNDYDVDQLVERVKDDIYSAASYRNANIISLSR